MPSTMKIWHMEHEQYLACWDGSCCCCSSAGSGRISTSGVARCSKDGALSRCRAVHESSAGTGAALGVGGDGRGICTGYQDRVHRLHSCMETERGCAAIAEHDVQGHRPITTCVSRFSLLLAGPDDRTPA